MLPSPVSRGDRYVKAWDIGRKDTSVCVVLRAPSADEAEIYNVVAYHRLVDVVGAGRGCRLSAKARQ
jgi:hypothetical protein